MEGQDAKKKKTEEAFQKWLSLLKGGDTPETIQFLADQDVDVRAGLEEMLGQYKNLVKETKAASIEGGGHVEILLLVLLLLILLPRGSFRLRGLQLLLIVVDVDG